MKRGLVVVFVIFMMMTMMTGCARDDAANNAKFVSDFKQNGKYCFHGLKYGMSIDEVLKKEKIKKSDLIFPNYISEWGSTCLLNTNKQLYGIDGKVRHIYYIDNKGKYLSGGIIIYFDDEKKFINGCKKIGELLYKNFGDPHEVNNVVKYDKKQAWNSFMSPPNFSTTKEVEDYENKNPAKSAIPNFTWGTKENGINIMHSPRVKLDKNIYYD